MSVLIQANIILAGYPIRSMIMILMCMNIFFIGFGITVPNIFSIALVNHKKHSGSAGALLGFSYYIIITVVTGLMGYLHTGSLKSMPSYFMVLSFICMIIAISFVKSRLAISSESL